MKRKLVYGVLMLVLNVQSSHAAVASNVFRIQLVGIEGRPEEYPFEFRVSVNYLLPEGQYIYRSLTKLASLDQNQFKRFEMKNSTQNIGFTIARHSNNGSETFEILKNDDERIVATDFVLTVITDGWGLVTNSADNLKSCMEAILGFVHDPSCTFALVDNDIKYTFLIFRP